MFKPRTPEDQLLLSTVRIETDRANATGFFFGLKGQGDCLITSRHVVEGASSGVLRMHNAFWREECHASPTFDVELDDFENLWIKHPDDAIDLVALPSHIIDDAAAQTGNSAHWMTIESIMVPSANRLKDLEAVEDVLMVGYLNGLWDKSRNLPIYRSGITASHPAVDFCGRPELLLDIACFPGSHGAPVFILDAKGHSDERGNPRVGEPHNLLLGVVCAAATIGLDGEIGPAPASKAIGTREEFAIHLTYIIKSRELLRFAEVVSQRQKMAST